MTIRSIKATLKFLYLSLAILAAACSSPASIPAGGAAVPHFEELARAVSSGSTKDIAALFQFSTMPCTKAEGMGGPPKCLADEAEGTRVEVLPILGPEGHHMRRSEAGAWAGIGAAQLYAAYRISKSTYSDEFFPAGAYGVAFVLADKANGVVFQVTEQGIVRIDYQLLSSIDETLKDSEVIVGPIQPAQ